MSTRMVWMTHVIYSTHCILNYTSLPIRLDNIIRIYCILIFVIVDNFLEKWWSLIFWYSEWYFTPFSSTTTMHGHRTRSNDYRLYAHDVSELSTVQIPNQYSWPVTQSRIQIIISHKMSFQVGGIWFVTCARPTHTHTFTFASFKL